MGVLSHNDIGLLYLDKPITHKRAQAISLLPSLKGVGRGRSNGIRGLGYYGEKTSDTDTLETHITHIRTNADCAKEFKPGYTVKDDTICVEDMDPISPCGKTKRMEDGLCYTPCKKGYTRRAFRCYKNG